MKNLKILSLTLALVLGGCASTKKSVLLGVGTGAATGAASGAMLGKKNKGMAALTGAAVGAIIGGIASYVIDDGIKKRDKKVRRDTLFNLEKNGISSPQPSSGYTPKVSPAVIEEMDVGFQRKGKKLIGPHKVYIIKEDPHWILDDAEEKKEGKN